MVPVIGGIILFGAVDRALNYTEVPATVEGLAELCTPKAMAGADRNKLESHPEWGPQPWRDCGSAAAFVASNPNFEVVKTERMLVRYRSPVDGQEHVTNIQAPVEPQATGSIISLYAHDKDIERVKRG